MPQAANLTVKNAALVDKTFTLLSPAPGYGAQGAEWVLKEGATSVAYPLVTLSASKTPNRSKKAAVKIRVPAVYTSVATGLPVVSSNIEFNGTCSVPDDFPDSQKDDAVAYITGVISTSLIKACLRDGLPAT